MKCSNIILDGKITGQSVLLKMTEENIIECFRVENGKLAKDKTVVCKCGTNSFDALMKDGDIHVVSGDIDGNIVYIRIKNDGITEKIVMTSALNENVVFDNFCIFSHGKIFSAIYTATVNRQCVLCHQQIGEKIHKPVAVNELSVNGEVFCSCSDNGDITVFFRDPKSGNFGCKIFSAVENKWSNFYNLFSGVKDISQPFVIDVGNAKCLCYKSNGELLLGRIVGGRKSGNNKLLSRRHSERASQPILIDEDERLSLLWCSKKTVFYTYENKETGNWQRIKEENINCDSGIELCKLRWDSSNKTVYDLLFVKDENVNFYRNIYNLKKDREERRVMQNMKSREEIEREKEQIMKQLGIAKGNDSFDFETEKTLINQGTHRFSSADETVKKSTQEMLKNRENEILNELKKISKNLAFLVESIDKNNKNDSRNGKPTRKRKRISVKVHKK